MRMWKITLYRKMGLEELKQMRKRREKSLMFLDKIIKDKEEGWRYYLQKSGRSVWKKKEDKQ